MAPIMKESYKILESSPGKFSIYHLFSCSLVKK